MRYSLADYVVTITPPSSAASVFSPISIGGSDEYVGSINIDYANSLYDISSYPTGAYVFNKNLARNGTVSISIVQLANQVAQLKQMVGVLFNNETDYEGFTISVTQRNQPIVSCEDCFPTKIPTQVLEATAQMQTWQFLSGSISYE